MAERAQGAAGGRAGFDGGQHVRLGEQRAEPGAGGGGAGDEGEQPGVAARQGFARAAAGRGRREAALARAGREMGGEAGGEKPQADADEDDERPGEAAGEALGRDDVVQPVKDAGETLGRGCGAARGHGSAWTMKAGGWASVFTPLRLLLPPALFPDLTPALAPALAGWDQAGSWMRRAGFGARRRGMGAMGADAA